MQKLIADSIELVHSMGATVLDIHLYNAEFSKADHLNLITEDTVWINIAIEHSYKFRISILVLVFLKGSWIQILYSLVKAGKQTFHKTSSVQEFRILYSVISEKPPNSLMLDSRKM